MIQKVPSTPLRHLGEPVAYALLPFLVHAGVDRLLLPSGDVTVETPDGIRFRLDPADEIAREILHFGAYEKRNVEIIRRLSKGRSGTLMDVGANIGNHALLLAGGFARVAAFEPNPLTLPRLRANLALNEPHNVTVFPFGLSDRDATLPFHAESGRNPGASRFLDAETDGSHSLPVRLGDDVVAEHALSPVATLKIDVEGHEEAVLAGLAGTIARDRPLVFLEWDAGRNGPGCLARLDGYRWFAQDWELTGSRALRPFARGWALRRPPRLIHVDSPDLAGRYVSMLIAVPEEAGSLRAGIESGRVWE